MKICFLKTQKSSQHCFPFEDLVEARFNPWWHNFDKKCKNRAQKRANLKEERCVVELVSQHRAPCASILSGSKSARTCEPAKGQPSETGRCATGASQIRLADKRGTRITRFPQSSWNFSQKLEKSDAEDSLIVVGSFDGIRLDSAQCIAK